MSGSGGGIGRLLTKSALVRVVGAIAQLCMTVSITRAMPSDEAGSVLFGYAVIMLASQVSLLGSELSGLRIAAINYNDHDRCALRINCIIRIRFVLVVAAVTALLVFTILLAFKLGGPTGLAGLDAALTAAAIPLYALMLLLVELLKGVGRPVAGLFFQNILVPLVVISLIFVGYIHSSTPSVRYVVTALFVACLAAALASVACLIASVRLRASDFWKGSARVLVREAVLVAPVSGTPAIIQWSGAALLGVLASPADVAAYVVAARVTIAVSVIHSAVASVAAPRLAVAHHSGSSEEFRFAGLQTGLIISASALPILVCLFVFPEPILQVFGQHYVDSGASLLRVLLAGQFVAALLGHSGTVLLMSGKFRESSINSVAFALFQLAGLAGLVPFLGALGAAMATSITVACGHIATLILVRKAVGFWPIPLTWREVSQGLGVAAR